MMNERLLDNETGVDTNEHHQQHQHQQQQFHRIDGNEYNNAQIIPSESTSIPMNSQLVKRRLSSIYRQSIFDRIDVTVECDHINYDVPSKQVLKDVSVKFQPSTLTAMLGPSGSGKTSLMSCILGQAPGKVTGNIYINGVSGIPLHFKSLARLVPQEDVMLPSFTVRETLMFQADLCLPATLTLKDKQERVQAVLQSLDLVDCADTKVGNVDERGISGGQRKRCSIGMELLTNPMVLCLDEPTSGLDSTSAENVVEILKMVARSGRTVITTIHQPSWRIFQLFDQVVFITQGRIAYFGPMTRTEEYFTSIGYPAPPKENPVDEYMRLIQDPIIRERIAVEYEKVRETYAPTLLLKDKMGNGVNKTDEVDAKTPPLYAISRLRQISVLFRRTVLDTVKDKTKFLTQLGLKITVGVMVGTVWFGQADPPKQVNMTSIEGALLLCVMNSTIETLALTIITFPIVRSLLLREYSNGSYSLISFYVAQILSMFLFSTIYTFVMAFPLYFMVGLQRDSEKLLVFMLGMLLMTLIGGCLGLIVGSTSKDIMAAQGKLAPLLAPLLLFSGYVIPYAQIKPYFRWAYYISFFRIGISLFELNQFTGLVFEDYNMDIFHPLHIRPFKTGEQFLRQVLSIDPDKESVWRFLGMLLGYACFFVLAGYFVIAYEVRKKWR